MELELEFHKNFSKELKCMKLKLPDKLEFHVFEF